MSRITSDFLLSPQFVLELVLPQSTALNETSVAVHTRIGRDAMLDEPDEDEREEEPTYFLPRIAKHPYDNLPDCLDCRQWSIIAQAQKSIVQLFCLPLGWKESSEEGYLEEGEVEDIPFYLTAKLVFPSSGLIKEVGFYGDDGKSSLSSGNDSGSGKEGRQKIGILFQEEKIELWLTPYDSLLWQAVPFESIFMEASQVDQQCTKMVQAIPEISKEDEEMLDTEVLWAQSKLSRGVAVLVLK